MTESSYAIKARWLFPITSPPVENGILSIADGKIAAVGENVSGAPPRDMGEVAILPGLINAHTHLEFSDLAEPLAVQGRFPEWIRRVIDYRTNRGEGKRPAIEAGLAESATGGVAAIGEIAALPHEIQAYQSSDPCGTIFLELLGLAADREAELIAAARKHLETQGDRAQWQHGLSPHAPYTASPELVAAAVALAGEFDAPVAMHLAETREEMELLATGGGPLVEFLNEIGAWRSAAIPLGSEPLDYLKLLAAAPRSLVIHGNYLIEPELRFLAEHRDRMSLVYCPRTHAAFGHPAYPLIGALAAGVRVAIGTDSRASNPDLSVFEELRHAVGQFPTVCREQLLALATINGAEALGVDDHLGSLEVGKSAQLAVVRLADSDGDAYDRLLAADSSIVSP